MPEASRACSRRRSTSKPDRRHQSIAHLRAEIDQARRAQEGDKYRVVRVGVDRYARFEELIDERQRAWARRLGPAGDRPGVAISDS